MFTFAITYREALKIAKKLAHSISRDETRYTLCGFSMHESEGKHYAVSTDGHMLTRLEIEPEILSQCGGPFPAVIFPTAAIRQIEAMKPADKESAPVVFTVDGLGYTIACGDQSAGGKLVDGTYPDYTRVIPSGWRDFTNEYGDCGFNPAYLSAIFKAASYDADAFKAGKSGGVRLFFEGGNPAVAVEERDPAVLYVVMPLRTGLPEHRHTPAQSPELAA